MLKISNTRSHMSFIRDDYKCSRETRKFKYFGRNQWKNIHFRQIFEWMNFFEMAWINVDLNAMDECIFACQWIEMLRNNWADSSDCMQIWQIFVFAAWIRFHHECSSRYPMRTIIITLRNVLQMLVNIKQINREIVPFPPRDSF